MPFQKQCKRNVNTFDSDMATRDNLTFLFFLLKPLNQV